METKGEHGPQNQLESVWDYPRPPRLEKSMRCLRIVHAGMVIAETTLSLRVLETSHPPVYYIPQQDIAMQYMQTSSCKGSFCEFKGVATYWSLLVPDQPIVTDAAWSYASPSSSYVPLKDHLAFYANRIDECTVDGERVIAQPGDFYGGWITSHVKGPFKGAPGTLSW